VNYANLKISIVIPVYQAQDCLIELNNRIIDVISYTPYTFEIIYIEDCSIDNSLAILTKIKAENFKNNIIILSNEVNYGQHISILHGLRKSTGDLVIVMDCDLQDNPTDILLLLESYINNTNIQIHQITVKNHTDFFRNLASRLAINTYSLFMHENVKNSGANFKLVTRNVVNQIIKLNVNLLSFPLDLFYLRYEAKSLFGNKEQRYSGKSSYSLYKLIELMILTFVYKESKQWRLIFIPTVILNIFLIIFNIELILSLSLNVILISVLFTFIKFFKNKINKIKYLQTITTEIT